MPWKPTWGRNRRWGEMLLALFLVVHGAIVLLDVAGPLLVNANAAAAGVLLFLGR